jgi:hypothetical protein
VQPGDPEARYTTNDLPGCPPGGLLAGTDKPDKLAGEDGDDEIRGFGASDELQGGDGSDVIYGGLGNDGPWIWWFAGGRGEDVLYGGPGDDVLWGGPGEDAIYGGDGDDSLETSFFFLDEKRDKLYCGEFDPLGHRWMADSPGSEGCSVQGR